MKKNLIIYLTVIGLIGLFSSCAKDETRVVILASPVAPTIKTMPNLVLDKDHGSDILTFTGTPVDPGFQASVNYYLEACPAGNKFSDTATVIILSSIQAAEFKITTGEFNASLLKILPAFTAINADFRIRSVLVADAGKGVAPLVTSSATKTAEVYLYELPSLYLLESGINQKIESPLGDGKYSGFVKLDTLQPFTLQDRPNNKVYGGSGGTLVAGGPAIQMEALDPVDGNGWYKLTANTNDLTYVLSQYRIGLVGSATPNAWNAPDQPMDYDAKSGTWKISIDLIAGDIKFRLNDAWAWNLGGTSANLTQGGANITVAKGHYSITLTINSDGSTGTCTLLKN